MNNLTCVLFPDMVRLLIAQAASFWVWNSPLMFHNRWWTKMVSRTMMGLKSQLGERRWFSRSQLTWTNGWWPWAQARFQSLLALAVGFLLLCWTRTTPPPASDKIRILILKRSNYLVDLLLAVIEKAWEVLQCSLKYSRIARHLLRMGTKVHSIENRNLVQNSLRLIIRARHNISHSSQRCRLNFHLRIRIIETSL